jgi:hypothetical protein
MSAIPQTRRNTRVLGIPPIGRPIVPRITYDIFEALKLQNRAERWHPLAPEKIDKSLSESSSSDEETSDAEKEQDPLDLHYVWENGVKKRLLGTLQRERTA